jgi:hypothetical protein
MRFHLPTPVRISTAATGVFIALLGTAPIHPQAGHNGSREHGDDEMGLVERLLLEELISMPWSLLTAYQRGWQVRS